MSCGRGGDHVGSLAAVGKVSEVADGELLNTLEGVGFGLGGTAFGEAGVEGRLRHGVGEE